MTPPLFRFVQFEFPWELGPPEGRYVIRGHAGVPAHVLVVSILGAPERRALLRRARAKSVAPEPEPTPVPTTRVTLVAAEPFPDTDAAQRWRRKADGEAEAQSALAVVNEVLHAQRTAAGDPYVREVSLAQALVARMGIGEGEQVAHGRWTDAVELPRERSRAVERRASALRPQERLAALLSGRDVALASEELALRARLDLDSGRTREAALQLRIALEAALAELAPWGDRGDMRSRIGELRDARGVVGDAANQAIQGGLDDATIADVGRVLARLEAALRARIAVGLE